jgi:hypothetical protein
MNLSSLIQKLTIIISLNADFAVYEFFSDIPVSDRIFSVAGISSLKINHGGEFDTATGLPVAVQVKISLFAPPETDKLILMDKYENSIINVLLNSNLRITDISGCKTEINKSFQLAEIYSFVTISGFLYQSGGR